MEGAGVRWSSTIIFFIFLLTSIHFLHPLLLAHITLSFNVNGVAVKRSPDLPLRFRSDTGAFKILQVADMHFGQGAITRCKDVRSSEFLFCSDLNTTHFIRRLIEAENPDFIAFTGDNIFGSSTPDAAESLFQAFSPAMESSLPWAAILGNHDQESTMNREELMYLISLMDYSVAQVNPIFEKIDGFGNYELRVNGPYGSSMANETVFNLLFLDSGDRYTVNGRRTYDWIKESQLDWVRRASPNPAIVFFHIPIPEVRDLYYDRTIVGEFQEGVGCSIVNSGVLKTLVWMKNVKAVFMGHDHVNDFCGNLDGLWFCYGGGCGYHGYGKAGWHRRARIIMAELEERDGKWMELQRLRTWKRLDDEMMSKIDEQLLWDQHS